MMPTVVPFNMLSGKTNEYWQLSGVLPYESGTVW